MRSNDKLVLGIDRSRRRLASGRQIGEHGKDPAHVYRLTSLEAGRPHLGQGEDCRRVCEDEEDESLDEDEQAHLHQIITRALKAHFRS